MEDGTQRGLCEFYAIWDLYHQYVLNEQSMLQRRSALLLQYEHSNRNWDKAKAHKKDEVPDSSLFKTYLELLVCHFSVGNLTNREREDGKRNLLIGTLPET